MVYYFYGPDMYAAREAINLLAKNKKASLRWIDKEETDKMTPGQWLPQGGQSLFGMRLTVLRDVSSWSKDTQAVLSEACRKGLVKDCVVWDRGRIDKRSALHKSLKHRVKEFKTPSRPQLVAWLADEARKREGSVDVLAAGLMVDRLGFERFLLISELEKLLLTNKTVTKEVVEKLVAPANFQTEIFAMLDALRSGNSVKALSIMEELLLAGEKELSVLSMIAWQFQGLLLVKQGMSQGKGKNQISKDSGLHPYVVQKNMTTATRYKSEYLLEALTRALATDFTIKQGKVDMRTGLVMYVLTLVKS